MVILLSRARSGGGRARTGFPDIMPFWAADASRAPAPADRRRTANAVV
jgi:hypothetical protein